MARMIQPMKIWKLPDTKKHMVSEVCGSGEYFLQTKKDGFFYMFEKDENGECYLFSRSVSRVTGTLSEKLSNVPHIKEVFQVIPNDTVILGEIYYPGKESKDTTQIMGCLPEKAIKRQKGEYGLIHYYIHDIIYLNGESLLNTAAIDRYNILKTEIWEKYNLSQYPFVELAECITEGLEEYAANALAIGEEGVVLKKKSAGYTPDKRPAWDTIKIKKDDTVDMICIGFENATQEYNGKELDTWQYWETYDETWGDYVKVCGSYFEAYQNNPTHYRPVTKPYFFNWKTAIVIGAYDEKGEIKKVGTVSSGLTDELREAFSERPDEYLNKVVVINCMERNKKDKTLRHPLFVSFREDKPAKDCTLKEIFD